MGRSDAFATEHDLEAEEYVPLPKGDVFKKKEVIQVRTLSDHLTPHVDSLCNTRMSLCTTSMWPMHVPKEAKMSCRCSVKL